MISQDDRSNLLKKTLDGVVSAENRMGLGKMARGETKRKLLDVGRRIFAERGFHHAGIDIILKTADVPKGSFYNYFESKEDFGLSVIDDFASRCDEEIEKYLGDRSLRPLERLTKHCESMIERMSSGGCRHGCLVGMLSQEMADQSEIFRHRLEDVFGRWVDRYAECLGEAQEAREIPKALDVHEIAEFWLNSWQGAILRAKTAKSAEPLRQFLKVMIEVVLRV